MTFDAREISRAGGEPFYLYYFFWGPGPSEYYGYTSAESVVSFTSDFTKTFYPAPITHGNHTLSGGAEKTTFEIYAPAGTDLIDTFLDNYSSNVMYIAVLKGHVGETEYAPEFAGTVLGVTTLEGKATYQCEPFKNAKRQGLRRKSQIGCGALLFGPDCLANKAAVTSNATVGLVDGPFVTLSGSWNAHGTKTQYIEGLIEWTTAQGRVESRSIIDVAGDALQLSAEASGLTAGITARITPGCAHNRADCANIFNNIANYPGHDFIPAQMPLGIRNIFY